MGTMMDKGYILNVTDAATLLVECWSRSGMVMRALKARPDERMFETLLHQSKTSSLKLFASFRIKFDSEASSGFFEFGMFFSWEEIEQIRNKKHPRRFPVGDETPAIALSSLTRDPEYFVRGSPLLLSREKRETLMTLFESNRNAMLLDALPTLRSLCEPELLLQELHREVSKRIVDAQPTTIIIIDDLINQ
jgi:hypothetical protein